MRFSLSLQNFICRDYCYKILLTTKYLCLLDSDVNSWKQLLFSNFHFQSKETIFNSFLKLSPVGCGGVGCMGYVYVGGLDENGPP